MADQLILIIEDNERNLKLVRDVLQFSGFRTAEARTAEDGLALASARPPDLADVRGRSAGWMALEVAAAGGHHLLLIGPPGVVSINTKHHRTGKLVLAGEELILNGYGSDYVPTCSSDEQRSSWRCCFTHVPMMSSLISVLLYERPAVRSRRSIGSNSALNSKP